MQKYNPYTVPEGFFDTLERNAVASAAKRRRTIRNGLAVAAMVIVLVAVPVAVTFQNEESPKIAQENASDNLANMYECDIFLQLSF